MRRQPNIGDSVSHLYISLRNEVERFGRYSRCETEEADDARGPLLEVAARDLIRTAEIFVRAARQAEVDLANEEA